MELEVRLNLNGPVEKFISRTIPGIFGPSEYDIGMVFTRPGRYTGSVMVEHVGRFTFVPAGHPTKQMKDDIAIISSLLLRRSGLDSLGGGRMVQIR